MRLRVIIVSAMTMAMGSLAAQSGDPTKHVVVPGNADVVFASAEIGSGAVVKGAPYSAVAVTEINQSLADGNRIHREMRGEVARDSEGRTRRNQQLGAVGPIATGIDLPRIATISDPVGGVTYILNLKDKSADKVPLPKFEGKFLSGGVGYAMMGPVTAPMPGPPPSAGGIVFEQRIEAPLNASAAQKDVKTEPLGKKVIEGIEVEGTRTTITIPEGQIGNERPIEVVTEHWVSPLLKTTVLSKSSDPRMGETSFRLINISLAEPAQSLFEVPAGFSVHEGPAMFKKPTKE
jgi:hypothetical protein